MHSLANLINAVNDKIGRIVSILTIFLVVIIIFDVLLRYFFSITSPASFELEWHIFAAIFLLGAGWTLQQDKHVRVDVFYQRFSLKGKAWVNATGAAFLLVPFCVIGLIESLPFVQASYMVRETSPDPGGLPARYIIKSVIPISFFLLGLQGISMFISSISCLLGNDGR